MKEADLARLIAIEVSRLGHRVFVQPTGGGWVGKVIKLAGGWVKILHPRFVKFGLCSGSSDLIGWTRDGRFLAIEVKTKNGVVRSDQAEFILAVRKSGGVAFVARSVADAREGLSGIQE